MAVRFRLLGELTVDVDGLPVELGHARQRCVLAVLLVESNRAVPLATLAQRVWAEEPPERRYSALHSYLSRLRGALARATDARIVRQTGGYMLTADPDAVDVLRFQRLVTRARVSAADDTAIALFDEALRLWRGDALAGLNSPWLNEIRHSLHRQRLAAELDRTSARWQPAPVVGRLRLGVPRSRLLIHSTAWLEPGRGARAAAATSEMMSPSRTAAPGRGGLASVAMVPNPVAQRHLVG